MVSAPCELMSSVFTVCIWVLVETFLCVTTGICEVGDKDLLCVLLVNASTSCYTCMVFHIHLLTCREGVKPIILDKELNILKSSHNE